MKCSAGAVLACAVFAAACGQTTRSQTAEEQVAHGKYLVEDIAGCNDCHTPQTAQGADMSRSLQGADLVFEPTIPMPWSSVAPSIAGLPSGYTDEQFAHLLQTGERPNGSHPLPPMPAFRFNADDARAITAFIKTLPRAEPASAPAAANAPSEAAH